MCVKTIVDENGLIICEETGEVLSEHPVETGNPVRAFSTAEYYSKSTTGGRVTFTRHDMGVGTISTRRDAEWSGLKELLKLLDTVVRNLGLPTPVHEDAARIARRIGYGKPRRDTVYIAVYIAMKLHGIAVDTARLLDACGLKKPPNKWFRKVVLDLGIKLEPSNPRDYIPIVLSRLDFLSPEERGRVTRIAVELLEQVESRPHPAFKPSLMAATLVLLALQRIGYDITVTRFSRMLGFYEAKVSAQYRAIKKLLG